MPADDYQPQSWPPPPGAGYEPPAQAHRFQWMLRWVGPVICGALGAVAGAVLLPIVLLVVIYVTNEPGGPIGFVAAMILVAIVGAGAGFVCGFVAWFVGKGVVRWWVHRHLRRQSPEP